ncbi:hypothetical protein CMO86_09230 [Candidatus Woesearchaeota archaeon]|nr:hypothetical protein [Candidatus Woesearchaeota archaeon]|tara:strand:+ start:251 stop:868 length:618 start_codon:yes stop_codon:yes gene_type:complete
MTFKENGFEVVRNIISNQLLEHLRLEFNMIKDISYFRNNSNNPYYFGDSQSPKSFSVYGPRFFECLSIQLKDKMSEIVGFDLHPTYTYARIYYKGAILKPHTDRPSCEYSTTICISSTDIWNFYIKDKNGKENIVKLNPGDMCVYSGCELEHWRKPFEGTEQMQCFLHYVNQNGKYKSHKYDKRRMMGIPEIIGESSKSKKINYN